MDDIQELGFSGIKLDRVCEECHGKGKHFPAIHSEDHERKCKTCDGSGYVMTEYGRMLGLFVERHFRVGLKRWMWDHDYMS